MVQIKISDPRDCGNSSLVLVTKVNASNSAAAGFIIWKSTSSPMWKCEYYCIKDSDLSENMTITKAGNLNSALEFWSDLLGSNPNRIVLKTDLKPGDWTTGVRVTAHQIQVNRSRKNLIRLDLHEDGPVDCQDYLSRYYNHIIDQFLDGNDRHKFKEQVQELIKPDTVRFESVTISQ